MFILQSCNPPTLKLQKVFYNLSLAKSRFDSGEADFAFALSVNKFLNKKFKSSKQ